MSESEVAGSDIYLQPSVLFEQGRSYLVRARSGHGKTSLLNFIYGISGQYDGEVVLTENGERRTENGERRAESGWRDTPRRFVFCSPLRYRNGHWQFLLPSPRGDG